MLFTYVITASLFTKHICKLGKYVNKRNCFVFIIHRLNKHGVSRRWLTIIYFKHFQNVSLKTITNITRNNFLSSEFLQRYFSRTLLIDLQLSTLKMDFFEGIFFRSIVDIFQNSYLSKKWKLKQRHC